MNGMMGHGMKIAHKAAASIMALGLVLLATNGTAQAWWNDKWEVRKKIVLDTTTAGANVDAAVGEVPVCVRLHSGNLDFQSVKPDGSDIRFVAGDDLTPLKHHFEWFDAVDQMALAWVKMPKLAANAKQEFIWMYYGNKEAPKAEDAGGVYDKNQLAVFHFPEVQGPPNDATAYGNHAEGFTGAQGLPSILGKGIQLAGGNDSLNIQSTPALDLAGGFTFTAWVKMSAAQAQDAVLLSRENGEGSIVIGIDKTRLYCRVKNGADDTLMTGPATEVKPGDWHHVAVSAEHKGKVALFIDGAKVYGIDLSSILPNLNSEIIIGNVSAGGRGFAGEMDEVGLSNTPRSESWIKALYASQVPQSKLLAFQPVEAYSGGSSNLLNYVGVVFKNTTLSGWSIIVIILIMLALSAVIFVDKAYTLRGIAKANRSFMLAMEPCEDMLECGLGDEYKDAPLGRIFSRGRAFALARLRQRGTGSYIGQRSLNSLRTVLEEGALREVQTLNRRMVVLTIAISGGPFLGLLGTVWGVMNTFAAMAMVGEANIMAIAPGVASALATTVFGLIVAIPALFAYNYLTVHIKDISADLYAFIDEFAANVEENYSLDADMVEGCEKRRISL